MAVPHPPAAGVRSRLSLGRAGIAAALLALLSACGGGGGDGGNAAAVVVQPYFATAAGTAVRAEVAPAPNVVPITLATGPRGRAFNAPFVSVTVCRPGTDICQVVDNILLDTGSDGLRIVASALRPDLGLPPVTNAAGAPVAECAHFASGHAWGGVRRADVRLAGQQAAGLSVHVYEDRSLPYGAEPASCASTPALAAILDSNGVLGIGLRRHDCGAACESVTPPARYFACVDGACTRTPLARAHQVANPVSALPAHNNGIAVVLPNVPLGGSEAVTGALVLGIATAANNQLGAVEVFAPDAAGFLRTTYEGRSVRAFLDTGTNSLFFADAQLPLCGAMYCPPAPTRRSATLMAANGTSRQVDFTLDTAQALPLGAIAASIGGGTRTYSYFNWGLPFFFGRTVHVAIEGAETPGGVGPYWAF